MGTALVCVMAALPGTAQANRPYEHFRDSVHFSETGQECGMPVSYETDARFHIIIKPVHDSDGQAILGQENYRSRTVVTNTVTKRWMVFRMVGTDKETRATHIQGNVWAFDAQSTGALFTVMDSNGKVVLRDRGRLTFRAVFDTLGDGKPGGTFLSEELTGRHGKFPGFDEELVCELFTELIG